jgi:hypothetical protein
MESVIKNELTWAQKHEKLIIVFLVLLVLGLLGNKFLNYSAMQGQARLTALTSQVQQIKEQSAAAAAQSAIDRAQLLAMTDALQKQNAALAAAVQSDNALLRKQQSINNSLALPDLAKRWAQLAPLQPGDLSATNGQVLVTDSGARATVNELEKVPVLSDQLDKQKQITSNDEALLSKSQEVNADFSKQVGILNSQIAADQKQCQAQIAVEKEKARKSKRNWFIAGFISGLATRAWFRF